MADTGDQAIPSSPRGRPAPGLEGLPRMDMGALEASVPSLVDSDPPVHTRGRNLVTKALSLRRLAAFEPILALAGTMDRFGFGNLELRATEQGPEELREISRRFNEMASTIAARSAGVSRMRLSGKPQKVTSSTPTIAAERICSCSRSGPACSGGIPAIPASPRDASA